MRSFRYARFLNNLRCKAAAIFRMRAHLNTARKWINITQQLQALEKLRFALACLRHILDAIEKAETYRHDKSDELRRFICAEPIAERFNHEKI